MKWFEVKILFVCALAIMTFLGLVYFRSEPMSLKEQLIDSVQAAQSGQAEKAQAFLIEAYKQHGEENLFLFYTGVMALLNRGYILEATKVLENARASLASEFEVWQEGKNLGKSKFICFFPIFVRTQMREAIADARIHEASQMMTKLNLKFDASYCNQSALPSQISEEYQTEQYQNLISKLPR